VVRMIGGGSFDFCLEHVNSAVNPSFLYLFRYSLSISSSKESFSSSSSS